VLLAKPLTFMNLSGRAVELLLAEYRLGLSELIVVLDDFNLPLGKIRVRERGSAGGHNGMESVLHALESDEFVRVRLGIGDENIPEDKAQFVLSDFPQALEGEVNEMILRARDAVKIILVDGASHAMSVFNG
jgi:PTH1 family peptidyl-tRNA hydrolase